MNIVITKAGRVRGTFNLGQTLRWSPRCSNVGVGKRAQNSWLQSPPGHPACSKSINLLFKSLIHNSESDQLTSLNLVTRMPEPCVSNSYSIYTYLPTNLQSTSLYYNNTL